MANQSLEQRFNKILNEYGRGPRKVTIEGKLNQEEFSYLIHTVQNYGFEFEPELYVTPYVERLEELVNEATN